MQKAQEQNIFIRGTGEAEQAGRVPGRAPPSPAIPPKRAKVTAEQGGPAAPVFLQELKDTAVSIGHDFLLMVVVTGNPQPHLTWYKEKVPLASIKKKVKEEEEEEEEEDYGSLRILNSKVSDAGVYSCVAKNKHGEAVSTATVTVTDMEEINPWHKPDSLLGHSVGQEWGTSVDAEHRPLSKHSSSHWTLRHEQNWEEKENLNACLSWA
ncbi:hypothetical protein E2320_020525 [Naja naja]|nr:hypothetical protein E2320_020525 [Naja naja]